MTIETTLEKKDFWTGVEDKKKVFLHDTKEYNDAVMEDPKYDDYDRRSLVIADADDLVLLRNRPDDAYVQYLYENKLGAAPANILHGGQRQRLDTRSLVEIMRDEHRDRLDEVGDAYLHAYVYNDEHEAFADELGVTYLGSSSEQSEHFNDKIAMKELAQEIGIPVAPGTTMQPGSNYGQIVEEALREHDTLFVRGAHGATSSDNYKVTRANLTEVVDQLEKRPQGYLVEPFLESEGSPSVLFRSLEDGAHRITPYSQQILSDTMEHKGNYYRNGELTDDMIRMLGYATRMAKAIHDKGGRGDFGIDFLKTADDDLMSEVNFRSTGATYLGAVHSRIEDRLGRSPYMVLLNTSMDAQSFDHFIDTVGSRLLYEDGDERGVIPSRFLPEHGEVSPIVFSTVPSDAWSMTKQVAERLDDEKALKYVQPYFQ
jgi:D-alanine-D-alanine ligase-like ATP-grasp enzyme